MKKGIKPWHVPALLKIIRVGISVIWRDIFQSDKHITSKGKKKHTLTHTHGNLLTQTFGFVCDAVSQKLTFRRSFVECHFLPAVHFVQAQTCQPAITTSAATIQQLFPALSEIACHPH